jgi:alkylhydroperoxidase family enzyme
MTSLFLPVVEQCPSQSPWGEAVTAMTGAGIPVPRILDLFNFKPAATRHLAAFSQAVMRGPSPLSPGERELIAAFTSRVNDCDF